MKKLLFLLAFISTPAFAIDRPIPCEGANCKLKFETRDGSNVKVSAGEVSGTTWTLGTSDSKVKIGGYSIASAMISTGSNCAASPCTITTNRGGMLSSVTRSGTGSYVVNFTASYWSDGPTCAVTATGGSGDVSCRLNLGTLSTVSYAVVCNLDNGGTPFDNNFSIICHGPRT